MRTQILILIGLLAFFGQSCAKLDSGASPKANEGLSQNGQTPPSSSLAGKAVSEDSVAEAEAQADELEEALNDLDNYRDGEGRVIASVGGTGKGEEAKIQPILDKRFEALADIAEKFDQRLSAERAGSSATAPTSHSVSLMILTEAPGMQLLQGALQNLPPQIMGLFQQFLNNHHPGRPGTQAGGVPAPLPQNGDACGVRSGPAPAGQTRVAHCGRRNGESGVCIRCDTDGDGSWDTPAQCSYGGWVPPGYTHDQCGVNGREGHRHTDET